MWAWCLNAVNTPVRTGKQNIENITTAFLFCWLQQILSGSWDMRAVLLCMHPRGKEMSTNCALGRCAESSCTGFWHCTHGVQRFAAAIPEGVRPCGGQRHRRDHPWKAQLQHTAQEDEVTFWSSVPCGSKLSAARLFWRGAMACFVEDVGDCKGILWKLWYL